MVNETVKTIQGVIQKSTKSITHALAKTDVETILNRALLPARHIIKYDLKEFPGKSLGFMAAHRNLVVTIHNEIVGEDEQYTFFVKCMPYGIDSQVSLIEDARAFRKETTYYSKIVPELTASVKDNVWGAKCFLVKSDVMVFENLKLKHFKVKEQFLDVRCVKAALLALTKLHSASLLTEKRLGQNLLELYPDVLTDRLFIRQGRTYDWCLTGVRVAVAAAEHFKLNSTLIPQICEQIYEAILPSKSMINGFCHGDTWSFNLLFDESTPVPTCLMVDYQIIRYAPIMSDVSLLLYLTTRREFRDKFEAELLAFYHESLCEKLKENNYQEPLPTFNQIVHEYEQVRIVGLVTALLYFPIIHLEGEKSSESTKSSDNYTKLQFSDRVSLVLDAMQGDLQYRDKIHEIVEETVQRAEQLLLVAKNN